MVSDVLLPITYRFRRILTTKGVQPEVAILSKPDGSRKLKASALASIFQQSDSSSLAEIKGFRPSERGATAPQVRDASQTEFCEVVLYFIPFWNFGSFFYFTENFLGIRNDIFLIFVFIIFF